MIFNNRKSGDPLMSFSFPFVVSLFAILSPDAGRSGTRTLVPGMMRRVLCHCATLADNVIEALNSYHLKDNTHLNSQRDKHSDLPQHPQGDSKSSIIGQVLDLVC